MALVMAMERILVPLRVVGGEERRRKGERRGTEEERTKGQINRKRTGRRCCQGADARHSSRKVTSLDDDCMDVGDVTQDLINMILSLAEVADVNSRCFAVSSVSFDPTIYSILLVPL